MENYICAQCNYSTSRTANYKRHLISAKHLQKVSHDDKIHNNNSEGIMSIQWTPSGLPVDYQSSKKNNDKSNYICEYCNKCITRYNNVKKHLNSCAEKKKEENNLKEHIKELSAQLELFKTKNEHYIEEVDHYKEEAHEM